MRRGYAVGVTFVISYSQALGQASGGNATVDLEIGTLRAILTRHRLWANIKPDVKKRPERDDVGVALDADAEERLLTACQASRSRMLWPAVVDARARLMQPSVPDSSPSCAIPFPRVVQVTIRPPFAPAEEDDSIALLVIREVSHGSWSRAG